MSLKQDYFDKLLNAMKNNTLFLIIFYHKNFLNGKRVCKIYASDLPSFFYDFWAYNDRDVIKELKIKIKNLDTLQSASLNCSSTICVYKAFEEIGY